MVQTALPGNGAEAADAGATDVVAAAAAAGDDAAAAAGAGDGAAGAEPSLSASIEAILLVVDEPIDEVTLAQVLEVPRDEISATLRRLAQEYTDAGRGFELRSVAGGWRLYTRTECAAVVERFVLDGQQAKLTQAALETLAVVAYRQPVSRARVSAIRGVNCDGVMRTLTTRGLVEEAGVDHESGATLFRTSSYFLERLGLSSLDELPPLAQYLPDIDDIENEGESVSSASHRIDVPDGALGAPTDDPDDVSDDEPGGEPENGPSGEPHLASADAADGGTPLGSQVQDG
ncbi:SMC-Scp complex subunit ScpB [Phytoactinopolyspora halotolerans]|uniref:SMC-Scp complex subunit ScpB n=2 Tax=Phytoactinopolyspora halotolerans TaxID=1981512 RepID=A0A6L9SFJ1_9ACTN|nr:SMC-Scp complex subunit ScpB [Phytoactinopolyspora halotolerans]